MFKSKINYVTAVRHCKVNQTPSKYNSWNMLYVGLCESWFYFVNRKLTSMYWNIMIHEILIIGEGLNRKAVRLYMNHQLQRGLIRCDLLYLLLFPWFRCLLCTVWWWSISNVIMISSYYAISGLANNIIIKLLRFYAFTLNYISTYLYAMSVHSGYKNA